ncbi:MAG: peptidoglycan/xylan/chitin deacetylase (PgdA/CDA1 family) [Hyphomicrobiaceae bacterium]
MRAYIESMKSKVWTGVARALVAVACFGCAPVAVAANYGPVIVTWNVETSDDAAALETLNIDIPATYFVTGSFAERHRELVLGFQASGTIGSLTYSHPDLTELDDDALHRELVLGKLVLEEVLGAPVTWFRAPWLASNQAVTRELASLGFTYDSSNLERWSDQLHLAELPISVEDGGQRPVSDFDLFADQAMTDDQALAWLLARLDERAGTGRPLVALLRPRIMAQHPALLDRFVSAARADGAEFITADQWIQRNRRPTGKRRALWVDLSQGPVDAALLRKDIDATGFTDVFLQARDADGIRYYQGSEADTPDQSQRFGEIVDALKGSDVNVHAWIAVNRDPWQATTHPERAMVSIDRERSQTWVSPAHADVQRALGEQIAVLLDRYRLDGIHLDYLRFPDLNHDFASNEVRTFRETYATDDVSLREMFDANYNAWVGRRSEQVRDLLKGVAEQLDARDGKRPELSVAVYADAATSYRVMETMGQDLSKLAPLADFLVPMAYLREQQRWPEWIENVGLAARARVGKTPLLAGLEAFQRPPAVTYTREEFGEAVDQAHRVFDGIAFYHYASLFGRSGGPADMPTGALDEALGAPAHIAVSPPATDPEHRDPISPSWPRYAALALVSLAAGAAAARGRSKRK